MEFALLLIVIIAGFLILGTIFSRKQTNTDLVELVKILQRGSQEDRELLMKTLSNTTLSFNTRLDATATSLSQLQRHLGEMNEMGKQIKEVQEFLLSPKLRGNLGEHVLSELLSQMLPKGSFHLQYSYRSGEKVDAAIQTSNGIIPIDAKFPMANFRRYMKSDDKAEKVMYKSGFIKDIKLHIDSIAKKYILPEEGTIDYALMYVPSEAVYYEVVNDHELFEYAGKKKILPVSPTTFYAYMKAILMSFEGQKIEAQAKEILNALKAVHADYDKVSSSLNLLQKHLTNAGAAMHTVMNSFQKLGDKVNNTKSLKEPEKV